MYSNLYGTRKTTNQMVYPFSQERGKFKMCLISSELEMLNYFIYSREWFKFLKTTFSSTQNFLNVFSLNHKKSLLDQCPHAVELFYPDLSVRSYLGISIFYRIEDNFRIPRCLNRVNILKCNQLFRSERGECLFGFDYELDQDGNKFYLDTHNLTTPIVDKTN